MLVGIDQPARDELVGADADAERGQVVQVLRNRGGGIGPAVSGDQVDLRVRVRLVVGELPVHHGRDAVGDQVTEGGVPVRHVVLALGVMDGVHDPAHVDQRVVADHPLERERVPRALDPEQVPRAHRVPDVRRQGRHAEGVVHVLERAAVQPQPPQCGVPHVGHGRPRLVVQVEDHLRVVAVVPGHVLPEDLGPRRRPGLVVPYRRRGEVGLVVEHHDQVVALGQGDLGLDGGHVLRVEARPCRPQQHVLVDLDPDRVGAPVVGRRRDLDQVLGDEPGPVPFLQPGHRHPVGDEHRAVLGQHLGAVDGERPDRLAARRGLGRGRLGVAQRHNQHDDEQRGQYQRRAPGQAPPVEPPAGSPAGRQLNRQPPRGEPVGITDPFHVATGKLPPVSMAAGTRAPVPQSGDGAGYGLVAP